MRIPEQYRQGDVLLEVVDALPAGAKRLDGPVILAYGEATGHKHEVTDAEIVEAYLAELDGVRYLVAPNGATLEHTGYAGPKEHATITLPPRIYRQVPQREYTPEAIRPVGD